MRTVKANGIALHVREDGDPSGRPVVFANSLGTDLRLWDAVVQHLPKDLRLIRFDKRGHGLSDAPMAPYAMDDLVRDAEQLLDALGVRDCMFVGLSIGGMIGQGLAALRPDIVQALVLSNTAAQMGTPEMWHARIAAIREGGIASIADTILDRWFSRDFQANGDVALWRNMMLRTPEQGYMGCAAAISEAKMWASIAELKVPVLGIGGALDGASPPGLVTDTVQKIEGAKMVVLPAVGHLPCVETPENYAAILTDFMEETGFV